MSKAVLAVLFAEALTIGAMGVTAADLLAHRRVERLGGVNVWGYRGPVMHQKSAAELRLAIVGGDLAYGWGVAASETAALAVQHLVALETEAAGRTPRPAVAVNLGALGLGPVEYAGWVDRFAYLEPDIICIVADPNGMRVLRRVLLPNRQSPFFSAFGYAPILPLVLEEKGVKLRNPMMERAGQFLARLDRADANTSTPAVEPTAYVAAIDATIGESLKVATRGVVLVLPRIDSAGDARDHLEIWSRLRRRLDAEPRLRMVDVGDEADMYDEGVTLNGFDFSAEGHARLANHVAPSVLELVR